MISHSSFRLSTIVVALVIAASAVAGQAYAQGRRSGGPGTQAVEPGQPGQRGAGGRGAGPAQVPSDPLSGPIVTNAPYSGDAVTTITQTLGDGTRIEERTEARFYRDNAGRVRREETIIGLPGTNLSTQPQTIITIDTDTNDTFAYTLDPATRTARRVPRGGQPLSINLNGAPYVAAFRVREIPPGDQLNQLANGLRVARAAGPGIARGTEESLGTRQMQGVAVTGRKTTSVIPVGQIGNDRPIEITDERWESPDLKLLVYSRFSDPRTGVVEFRLTNISRVEPPLDLFTIPPDYTVVEPGAGARGRGAPQRIQ